MKYIELTHVFNQDIPVSPFDQRPIFTRTKFKDKDLYNDTRLESTMHIGTHIDAPSHMLNSTKTIKDYEVDKFIGDAVVLDFKNKKVIDLREVDKELIKKDSIILIYTGEDKRFGTEDYYYNHPQITEPFCDYLVYKEVKLVGLDFFSPDSSPSIIHEKLLSKDILIVENLTNVDLLVNKDVKEVYMIPLKIEAEGSFIRAFAKVG